MNTLTSGELFAGVGGLGMAVDDVFGSRPAWFCEFDSGPSKVLAHRYPGVENFGDVTKVDFRTVPHTDIRCGGFPCTDVSLAGGRAGMKAGTRSGLWSEFARSIAEDRPDWVVIENVRGLFTASAAGDVEPCPWCVGDGAEQYTLRALDAVLADLSGLGFDAEWIGLRAADIGAPHGRFRVFIIAWPAERTVTHDHGKRLGGVRRSSGFVERDSHGRGREGAASGHLTLLPTPTASEGEKGGPNQAYGSGGATLSGTVPHLLPTPDAYSGSRGGSQHPDKRRDGGHTVSLADVTEHSLLGTPRASQGIVNDLRDPAVVGNPRGRLEDQIALMPTPSASNSHGNETNGRGESLLPGVAVDVPGADWGIYSDAIRRWEAVIGRAAPSPVRHDGKGGKPRLNPELTEWMMGWPLGWVTASVLGLTRQEQLKACGNGVVPQQAAFALRLLLARPGVPAITWGLAA